MTELSAEAYAIVEGRHSDPFHYLGRHTEGDQTVVRAFLPEASNVEAVGEHGETASLARIHDAGLFAGALPNGSRRYQLRARFGNNVVDVDEDGFEPARGGRSNRDFHFHRFDEYDVLAVANAAADLNRQRADPSGHFGYDLDLWHSVLRAFAARSRACAP